MRIACVSLIACAACSTTPFSSQPAADGGPSSEAQADAGDALATSEGGDSPSSLPEAGDAAVDSAACVPADASTSSSYSCEGTGPCSFGYPCCITTDYLGKSCDTPSDCTSSSKYSFICGGGADCTAQCLPAACCAPVSAGELTGSQCSSGCTGGQLRLCNQQTPGDCPAGSSCMRWASNPTGLFYCQ
jgi:hypothetical protein